MESVLSDLSGLLPEGVDLGTILTFLLFLIGGVLVLAILFRLIKGKCSDLNHALSSAMGILFIYAVSVLVYTFDPAGLSRFLSPLPFVSFDGDYLYILSLTNAGLPLVSSRVLSMVILAFLVNLLDTWIPKGEKILSWYTYRFVTVICAMALHFIVTRAFNSLIQGVLAAYAPMILLGMLVFMLLIGVIRFLLGLVLTIANPLVGGIYAFFFANKIGKQLSKAVLTTGILCVLVLVLERFGCTAICIAGSALIAYLPVIIVLLFLWFLIGRVL